MVGRLFISCNLFSSVRELRLVRSRSRLGDFGVSITLSGGIN